MSHPRGWSRGGGQGALAPAPDGKGPVFWAKTLNHMKELAPDSVKTQFCAGPLSCRYDDPFSIKHAHIRKSSEDKLPGFRITLPLKLCCEILKLEENIQQVIFSILKMLNFPYGP